MAGLLDLVRTKRIPFMEIEDLLRQPNLEERKKRLLTNIEDLSITDFDPGVFDVELLANRIVSQVDLDTPLNRLAIAKGNILIGTYDGTQAALTQAYKMIEKSYESWFDVHGIEPTIPVLFDLDVKRKIYQYSSFPYQENGSDLAYPPHLHHIPLPDQTPNVAIFNAAGILQTGVMLGKLIPDEFADDPAVKFVSSFARGLVGGMPQAGPTIADCERYNLFHRKTGTDIERGANFGMIPDWYSDRRFAEQSFTGTNPTTIKRVPQDLLNEFIETAKRTGYDYWAKTLATVNPDNLYVQDYSDFRKATGVKPDETFHWKEPKSDDNWSCAAVSLFQLFGDGKLHPVAIVCDYKESMATSVTIFNRRHRPSDPSIFEKTDWPWRYAKTCAQVSDWFLHEVGVHLTRSHFIEESVIVATHRTIPMTHIVYKLLQPHWYKTLSLNAGARKTLVPQVIKDLVGMSPEQCMKFMAYEFENFDYQQNYVPNDLKHRGFPNTKEGLEDKKYKNYAYAKNILSMWTVIRKYVKGMLLTEYNDEDTADEKIRNDTFIQDWCREAQTSGRIKNFPDIKSLEQLVDAITMSIHIAAPFHTTVNYLQNFYQAFVIAKPPMLCRPPPRTLDELLDYSEVEMTKALPIGRQREWLLSAQVPWLLSFKVAGERSLISFAHSQWRTHCRVGKDSKNIREVSEEFFYDLKDLEVEFSVTSRQMDRGSIPYMVMDPSNTAVSILI